MNRTAVIALLALALASGTTLAQDSLLDEALLIGREAAEEALEPVHYTYVGPGDNGLMIEAACKRYSNGANISYTLSFPARADVVTCAQKSGKAVMAAAVSHTSSGFRLSLKDHNGSSVSDAWVMWIAIYPMQYYDPTSGLRIETGCDKLSHGAHVSYKQSFAGKPVVVSCAQKSGVAKMSAPYNHTSSGFWISLKDHNGSSVSDAYVLWIAVYPEQVTLGSELYMDSQCAVRANYERVYYNVSFPAKAVPVACAQYSGVSKMACPYNNTSNEFWLYLTDHNGNSVSKAWTLSLAIYPEKYQPEPKICRSPTSLSNSCCQGQNASNQSFEVWNCGSGTLNYTISAEPYWLSCSPGSGTSTGGHNTHIVSYSTSGLSPGSHAGTITIRDPAATNSPQTIPVSLRVDSRLISRSPTSLTNSCFQGQNAPSQSFEVWNSGCGTLNYSITVNKPWLSCSPPGGTSSGGHNPHNVNYSTSGLSVGSHSATITISDPQASNSPRTIAVNLTVKPEPRICYSPTSLTITCCKGQSCSGQFEVWNCGTGTLNYTITGDAPWLSCTPAGGTSTGGHNPHNVDIAAAGLACGTTYSATITITDPAATNSPQTILVSVTVECPSICNSPTSLTPTCVEGENPPNDFFEVWNCGCGTLNYDVEDNVDWLECSPPSGTSTGKHETHSVVYSASGLTVGTYEGTITISDAAASNSPQTIPVTLTVTLPKPRICRDPAELAPWCYEGHNADEQSFEVWNCGQGTLDYTVKDNVDWLDCQPPGGQSTGAQHNTHKVTYDTAGLTKGTYLATITISDPLASNTPQTIEVTLTVREEEVYLIGGQVSTDPKNMIFTGINGVRIDVSPGSFWTETTTIKHVPGMWEIYNVPVGTYTVTPSKVGYAFIQYHVVGGKLGQPAPITIEVNQANQAKNQNLCFLAHVLGDLNCDELVNFDDIDPFVLALGGEPGYAAQYPDCIWRNADCNQDGTVDFHDIDPFVALLTGGG